jgi:two-component system, sensor histidine kinase and response regulator
MHIMDSMIRSE